MKWKVLYQRTINFNHTVSIANGAVWHILFVQDKEHRKEKKDKRRDKEKKKKNKDKDRDRDRHNRHHHEHKHDKNKHKEETVSVWLFLSVYVCISGDFGNGTDQVYCSLNARKFCPSWQAE